MSSVLRHNQSMEGAMLPSPSGLPHMGTKRMPHSVNSDAAVFNA